MEVVHAGTPPDIDKAFGLLSERRVGALLLGADAFYGGRIQQIVSLAARHKMPAMYYRREFAEAGGLASYGASVIDAWRQAGVYVAHIGKLGTSSAVSLSITCAPSRARHAPT
jgi:putative ABC transport system substrate-binding protein